MGVHVSALGAFTGTGNVTVSGLPFQPVAVIFWNEFQLLAPPGQMLGVATSSTDQWVIWAGIDTEISGYFKRYNEGRTDACIFNRAAPYTTVAYQASLVSMNSDGFTVSVDVHNATGEDIAYMAIGGLNIGEAHAGTITTGGSTGTEAVTGLGFEPSALIVAHTLEGAFDTGREDDDRWGVGVATATDQYSYYVQVPVSPGPVRHIHRTDEVACAADGTNTFRMALDSFDADGFTVDTTSAWTGDIELGYLAIEAAAAAAGNGIQPDSAGTQQFTGLGFRPEGVFFLWPGVDVPTTTGSNSQPQRPGVGGMSATAQIGVSMLYHPSAPFGVLTTTGYQDNVAMEIRGTGSGVGPNDNDPLATAGFDSFGPDDFTIDWVLADSGFDRAFGWLALPGDLPFSWTPNLYRRQDIGGHSVPPEPAFLLLEDGSRLILEDDSGFLLL